MSGIYFIFINLFVMLLGFLFHDKNRNIWHWPWFYVFLANFVFGTLFLTALQPYAMEWFFWHSILRLGDTEALLYPSLIAFFAGTLIDYWVHRCLHHSRILWRYLHHFHHSAPVMNVLVFAYVHPLDTLLRVVAINAGLLFILGLTPIHIFYGLIFPFSVGVFQHGNVKCPVWLDYLIMTPKMHKEHHKQDHHKNNYGLISLWDQLFGTFDHPEKTTERFGFNTFDLKKIALQIVCLHIVIDVFVNGFDLIKRSFHRGKRKLQNRRARG